MVTRFDTLEFSYNLQLSAQSWSGKGSLEISEGDFRSITEISKIAREKIQAYESDKSEISLQARVDTYSNLSKAVKAVADKINSTKSWFRRLINFFGIGLSKEEVIFRNTVSKINTLRSQWNKKSEKIYQNVFPLGKSFEKVLKKQIEVTTESTLNKFKENCFRVAPRLPEDPQGELLDKSNPSLSLKELRCDIEDFVSRYGDLIPGDDKQQLQQMITRLKGAYAISIDNLLLRAEKLGYSEERAADHGYRIERKIMQLNPGDSLILPGQSKLHAVIYKIQKEIGDTFSFEIFNTGDGSDHDLGFIDRALINWSWTSRSSIITGLSQEQISNNYFLGHLFTQTSEKMSDVIDYVQSYLIENCAGTLEKGGKYRLQTRGSCTFDSIMAYLKVNLSEPLFEALQLHMTRRAESNFPTISQKNSSVFTPEYMEALSLIAKETLAEREAAYKALWPKVEDPGLEESPLAEVAIDILPPEDEICIDMTAAEVESPKPSWKDRFRSFVASTTGFMALTKKKAHNVIYGHKLDAAEALKYHKFNQLFLS